MDFATPARMIQFLPSIAPAFRPILVDGPVELRPIADRDFAQWASLRDNSCAHLTLWEDCWTKKDVSEQSFRARRLGFEREARKGRAIAWHIFDQDGQLVGGVTLTNIRYGAARTGTLGYWIGVDYLRRGYASAAVRAVSAHVFETLKLNRIEAACQIENRASAGVLQKCGFVEEGIGVDYLRINGALRDHKLFAMVERLYRNAQNASGPHGHGNDNCLQVKKSRNTDPNGCDKITFGE